MSLYNATIPQMRKMLTNMKSWLVEAEQYADDQSFHQDNFLTARLRLDQFTLTQQIQSACDTAKGAAARVSGRENPRHEDNEATFEELVARVDKVLAFLDGFSEDDFAGIDDRVVSLPFLPPTKGAPAADYIIEFVLPNFYFHVTMVYAILRHNGVKLGKRKYIGGMNIIDT